MTATTIRTRGRKKADVPTAKFDARDVLAGRLDDTTVRQAVLHR